MSLGANQVIALMFLADNPDQTRPRKPWQLSRSQYDRVLASLAKRGLVEELSTRRVSIVLGGGAQKMADSQRFTPMYRITEKGWEALEGPTP